MQYPDGTEIPSTLPETYRIASTFDPQIGDPETIGQSCDTCNNFNNGYCSWWQAAVRPDYYCKEWARIEIKNTFKN